MSMVMPDEQVTTCIDADALVERKAAALRAYATQLRVEGAFFALSNGIGQPLVGTEYYRLAVGTPAGPFDTDGRETDLFAGLCIGGEGITGGCAPLSATDGTALSGR